jgi:hypothetical protein
MTSFTLQLLFYFYKISKKIKIKIKMHFKCEMTCLVVGIKLFKIVDKTILCSITIAACIAIQSCVTIISSNSLSLLEELKSRYDKTSSIDDKWNEPSKKWNKTPKTLKKSSNHWTLPNEIENLKLSNEMDWKKRGRNGIPPTYIASRAFKEKLPQPHNL